MRKNGKKKNSYDVDRSSSQRLRVARVIDRLNIGGPAKHVSWLTAELNSEEFETTLITGIVPDGEGDMSYFAREAGIEPVIIKEMSRELGLRDVVVIAKLVRQFFRLKPHIIHTHKAKAGAAGRIAAMIYKWATPSALWLRPRACRVVHTYHGHIFHSYYGRAKTRLFVAIERALARFFTDAVVVVSQQQRREISEEFRVGRKEQYRVIPLGLSFDEMAAARYRLREELSIAADDATIGIVGRLCEVKNHSMFLQAAAELAGETEQLQSRARFVVIGDGHLREELERQADRLKISEIVSFTGFRKDAASLYHDLDIVALTSLNEGTPLTLIEAMCAGRAVVATEVGGVVDILGAERERVDGFTVREHGITVESRNAKAFARALRYLIERPDVRLEMGARGREFITNQFSKERLLGDIEQLYRELAGNRVEMAPSGEAQPLRQPLEARNKS